MAEPKTIARINISPPCSVWTGGETRLETSEISLTGRPRNQSRNYAS
ncbi:hypothetical protein RB7542 [Rhodopirellula baltica SH 1]|uniref:Uncharacterized protein n=1 Tax=Rhodopirellula baltica (strain DSM 10527 / NCIMB 13988 / SH1) TaxID=243090 RepID=Q7UNK0_RHOBA|nr:hypothetical protein RB7542 [Rhodopirellula baltica SH 1]